MSVLVEQRHIETKFGNIYLTSYWENGELKKDDHLYWQDENFKMLDYMENDTTWNNAGGTAEKVEELFDLWEEQVKAKKSIEDILEWLGVDYDYCGKSKIEARKALAEYNEWEETYITDKELEESEYVCRIGSTYIVLRDY